jgi:hypothetical protein
LRSTATTGFAHATLSSATLSSATLSSATLSSATLSSATLSSATLSSATLPETSLGCPSLCDAALASGTAFAAHGHELVGAHVELRAAQTVTVDRAGHPQQVVGRCTGRVAGVDGGALGLQREIRWCVHVER